jgi:beta-phosphoglucomutase-like phosphatase (HAD superfamily)
VELSDLELARAAEASVSAVLDKLASLDCLAEDTAATTQQCESLIESRLLEAQPRPVGGLQPYLAALATEGVPRALLGQAERRTVESLLRELDLSELLGVLVTHDDARGIVTLLTEASARMGVDARCCLVTACTPSGVMAARDIGAACLAIPTFFPSQLLADAGVDWCVPDFLHLPELLRPTSRNSATSRTRDGAAHGGGRWT